MYNGTNSYSSDTLVVSLLHIIASHIACHIALILDTTNQPACGLSKAAIE